MTRDLDRLMETGEVRVAVKDLARAAAPLGQAAVTEVAGPAFLGDGGVVFCEAQSDVFEELFGVFLTFTR